MGKAISRGGKRTGSGRKAKGKCSSMLSKLVSNNIPVGMANAPVGMDLIATKEWNTIMAFYASYDTKVLDLLDMNQLQLYCESFSRYRHAYDKWKGKYKCDPTGNAGDDSFEDIKRLNKIMADETKMMVALSDTLYLSPKSRKSLEGFTPCSKNGVVLSPIDAIKDILA